jgi:hypothetical protein
MITLMAIRRGVWPLDLAEAGRVDFTAYAKLCPRWWLVGSTIAVIADIRTFAGLVTRVETTRHVTQVAVGVSLDILRHIVIRIDFLARVSLGHR